MFTDTSVSQDTPQDTPKHQDDREVIERFMTVLFGDALDTDHVLSIFDLPDARTRFFSDAASAADYVLTRRDWANVYFGVCLYRPDITAGRGKAKDVVSITALWLDLDIGKQNTPKDDKEAKQLIERIPLPPASAVLIVG